MEKTIKDILKGTTLYFYHLAHQEDEFIQEIMKRKAPEGIDVEYMCYKSIVKRGRVDIIHDLIQDMPQHELRIVARIAVKENNREIIELLYKNNLNMDFYIYNKQEDMFLVYVYKKGGFELIKFMGDTGFRVDDPWLFRYVFEKKDIDTLNYFLEITTEPLVKLCETVLKGHFDMLFLVDFFSDKIDMIKYKDEILSSCGSVDSAKSFIELMNITIDSNKPLKAACYNGQLKLVEFYLQYGPPIDIEVLKYIFFSRRYVFSKSIINLLLKYDVDLSPLNDVYEIDHEFIDSLENHGLNKDTLLEHIFSK